MELLISAGMINFKLIILNQRSHTQCLTPLTGSSRRSHTNMLVRTLVLFSRGRGDIDWKGERGNSLEGWNCFVS